MSDSVNLMDETRNGVTIVHVMTPWLLDPKLSEILTARLCSLIESGADRVLVDLSGVTRLSSVFFRSFITAGKKAKERKASMAFCNLSPMIKQGFTVTGMDKIFSIFDSEQKALVELSTE